MSGRTLGCAIRKMGCRCEILAREALHDRASADEGAGLERGLTDESDRDGHCVIGDELSFSLLSHCLLTGEDLRIFQ